MTVSFPLSSTQPIPPAPVKPDDGVTRFARISFVIGILLTGAITVTTLLFAGWGLFSTLKSFALWWLSLASLAWIVAWGFGAWWTFVFTVRRPVRLEDEDRQAAKPQVIPVYQTLDMPPLEAFARAGDKILWEYFYQSPTITREEAVNGGVCTQEQWNVFNSIAKQYEVRLTNNTWNAAKQDEAHYLWGATTFEMSGKTTLIAHLSGGVTLRFDLAKNGTLVK